MAAFASWTGLSRARRCAIASATTLIALLSAPVVRAAEPDSRFVLPAPKSFAAAVASIEKATGAKGGTLATADGPGIPFSEGRAFSVDASVSEQLLAGSHTTFRKAGFYLFRYERGFGLEGDKDVLGLAATADPDVVLRRVGTAGLRHGVTTEQIVAWLQALRQEEPFELLEIGADYVAGRFDRAPQDAAAIARRTAKFAPELVKGHSDPIAGLTHLIATKRTLYLIWD
jgi:hypothetical protein